MAIDSYLEIAKSNGYKSIEEFLRREAHYLTEEKQNKLYRLLTMNSASYSTGNKKYD